MLAIFLLACSTPVPEEAVPAPEAPATEPAPPGGGGKQGGDRTRRGKGREGKKPREADALCCCSTGEVFGTITTHEECRGECFDEWDKENFGTTPGSQCQ